MLSFQLHVLYQGQVMVYSRLTTTAKHILWISRKKVVHVRDGISVESHVIMQLLVVEQKEGLLRIWCPHATTYKISKLPISIIKPCRDRCDWEKMNGCEIKPPVYEKKVGRPTNKSIRKQPHEVQSKDGSKRMTRHG